MMIARILYSVGMPRDEARSTGRGMYALAALMIVSCLMLAGCGGGVSADISAYGDEEVSIEGLGDEEITITANDLIEMDCENTSVTTTSQGGEVTADVSGPSLDTLLGEYGTELGDVSKAVFTAKDGYTKEFDADFFITHPDVYLSVASGDEPLDDEESPVRLVIPGATSDNWVKGVVKIEFTGGESN